MRFSCGCDSTAQMHAPHVRSGLDTDRLVYPEVLDRQPADIQLKVTMFLPLLIRNQ